MSDIKKLYRISDAGYKKEKLSITEIECLKNFIDVFGTDDLYVLADNCGKNTKDTLDEIDDLNWKEIEGGSGAASWRIARDMALEEFDDNDIVYFVEDDYLHLKGSPDIIKEGIEMGADYVTLYDHPDKYINAEHGGNKHVQGGGEVTRVMLTESTHWKLTNSTTMTFACKVETIREDNYIWKRHTGGTHPDDYSAFMDLRDIGRILVSPIPSYSTHIETNWLAPLRNWKGLV